MTMTRAQRVHINSITKDFKFKATAKYAKGAAEHGGNLWEVADLVDMAIEELTDGIIYLSTVKQQLESQGIVLGKRKDLIK